MIAMLVHQLVPLYSSYILLFKNLYKIDHLGVRFYRDEAGRPVFTIEWYLDCAHAVYIPKSDTKFEALQTQFSMLWGVFFLITWTQVFIL